MATDAERLIRLILKVSGSEEFKKLQEAASDTKDSLKEIEKAADEAGDAMGDVAGDPADKLKEAMDESKERVTGLLESLAGGATGGGGLAGAFAGLATGMVPVVGQLLQSQAAMEALATAASAAFSALMSAMEDYFAGENTIDDIADSTERLTASLEITNKRIDELREKQSLTNAEFAEYNRLVNERKQVEEAAKDAKASVDTLDSLREKEKEGRRSQEGAEAVKASIEKAGGVDAVLNQIIAGLGGSDLTNAARAKLTAESAPEIDAAVAGGGLGGSLMAQGRQEAIDKATADYEAILAKAKDQAEQMLGAAARGEAWAAQQLTGYAPGMGFESATEDGLRRSALARKQQEDAEFTAKQNADNAAIDASEAQDRAKARADYDKAQEKAKADEAKAKAKADREQAKADAEAQREWKAMMNTPEAKAAFNEWFDEQTAGMYDWVGDDDGTIAGRRKAIRSGVESEVASMGWIEGPNAMEQGKLNRLINDATNRAKGTDVSSISQAIDEALAALTDKIASEIQRSMKRSGVQSNSHYSMY